MNLILHVLFCSLAIFGLWNSANPGFIFSKVDLFLEPRLPEWLYKPLIGCVICMASFWGAAYYFYFVGFDAGVLFFIPAVSGVNYLVLKLMPE